MAEKSIDPAATALGAMGLGTELIGTLARQGVLEMEQIARIFDAVAKSLPPGQHKGLAELLAEQRDLANKFAAEV